LATPQSAPVLERLGPSRNLVLTQGRRGAFGEKEQDSLGLVRMDRVELSGRGPSQEKARCAGSCAATPSFLGSHSVSRMARRAPARFASNSSRRKR